MQTVSTIYFDLVDLPKMQLVLELKKYKSHIYPNNAPMQFFYYAYKIDLNASTHLDFVWLRKPEVTAVGHALMDDRSSYLLSQNSSCVKAVKTSDKR